ncbi:predicted protein [Uncinocarpus reesii 1704]|uniref:Calcineurin-like phosphoesterase domain-containing protein n=1 Tax=Uncinocarpus reesii (strain UAMH 1704) TaxID=336963 RepID=C4JVI0_UNCRE|nr:uncharacterized protein UREG_06572 [Uncinocarpus reesii 1704]EEP81707.1 predicted protein [Uncinocarpus reesii 1704]
MATNMEEELVKTRICMISDTHTCAPLPPVEMSTPYRRPLPSADVLLHAGDLTFIGLQKEHQCMVDMLKEADAELKIVIAGNHDITLDQEYYNTYGEARHRGSIEDVARIRDLYCGEEARRHGIVYMDEGLRTFKLKNGAQFTVYASPYQPAFCNWAFGYEHHVDRFNTSAADAPFQAPNPVPSFPNVHIMLTHGPPEGILDLVSGNMNMWTFRWRQRRSLTNKLKELGDYSRKVIKPLFTFIYVTGGISRILFSLDILNGITDGNLNHHNIRTDQCPSTMEGTLLEAVEEAWDTYLNRCTENVSMLTPNMKINERAFSLVPCFEHVERYPGDPLRNPESFLLAIYDQTTAANPPTGDIEISAESGEPGVIFNYLAIQRKVYRLRRTLSLEHKRVFDDLTMLRTRYFAAFLKLIICLPQYYDTRAERIMLEEEQRMKLRGDWKSTGMG